MTKSINVTAVNDAPVVSSFGDNLSYTEDSSPIIVTTGALIGDVDSINFDTGKLIVRVLVNAHASDRIGIRHQGTNPGQIGISGSDVTYGGVVIGTFAGTTVLTVTLNGNADSASVQALLRNITFQNISQAPSTLTRTLSATLSDGDGGTSLAVTKTVAVTALNDDPVIGAFDTTITYVENAVPILLDTNATVVDPDLKGFDGGVLTVSLTVNGHANDRMAIRNQGTGAGLIGVNLGSVTYGGVAIGTFTGGTSGTDPLRITFNAAASSLVVQALVRNLTFSNTSESPSTLPRTVQLQLTDGDGGTSAAVTKSVNVTSIDDAPVVAGFNDSVAYFIQGTPVILDFDTTITDVDSTNFETGNLTVSLTTNVQATDRLSIASVGNDSWQIRTAVSAESGSVMNVFYEGVLIGSYSTASTTTLKVTLNANSSSAAAGALLRRVTFHSTSATPSNAVRTVQVTVNDGDGKSSLIAAKTISFNTPVTPTGGWTDGSPTANLTSNHVLGAATRLSNGTVIVAGGLTGVSAIKTAEVYNPITKTWSTTGPLGTARWSLDAITLDNGKALFAGGASAFSASAALASAELYDPATGTFSPTTNDLSVGRQGFGISRLNNGRILITGGNATGNNLNGTGVTAVDIYDPVTNSFSPAAPLHSGRALHAQVTLSDGRVLVIGGAQRDAELYDPVTNTWSVSSNLLPTTLKDMKAFELYNGRVFIAAGQNTVDGVTTDATWFFDVGTMQFTPGPSMASFNSAVSGPQVGASDYSAFDLFPVGHPLRGRYLLFAGGEHDPLVGPDVELNSASIFDAQQNHFFNVGPMPFTHDDHTESLLQINAAGNPEVLVFGGGQTQRTSRFEFLISSLG